MSFVDATSSSEDELDEEKRAKIAGIDLAFANMKRSQDGDGAILTKTETFLVQWCHRLLEGVEPTADELIEQTERNAWRYGG